LAKKPLLQTKGFGEWLTKAKHGRSHAEFAVPIRELLKPTGMRVNRSAIEKLENGRLPSVLMLYALSRVLHVPLEELTARVLSEVGLLAKGAVEFPHTPPPEPITAEMRGALEVWERLSPDVKAVLKAMTAKLQPQIEEQVRERKSDAAEEPRKKTTVRTRRIIGTDRSRKNPRLPHR
jgi:transcriptional regulator with XRE-family HTH domain